MNAWKKTFKLIVTKTISAWSSVVIFGSYCYRQTTCTPNSFSCSDSWEIIFTDKEIPTNRPGKKLQKAVIKHMFSNKLARSTNTLRWFRIKLFLTLKTNHLSQRFPTVLHLWISKRFLAVTQTQHHTAIITSLFPQACHDCHVCLESSHWQRGVFSPQPGYHHSGSVFEVGKDIDQISWKPVGVS